MMDVPWRAGEPIEALIREGGIKGLLLKVGDEGHARRSQRQAGQCQYGPPLGHFRQRPGARSNTL